MHVVTLIGYERRKGSKRMNNEQKRCAFVPRRSTFKWLDFGAHVSVAWRMREWRTRDVEDLGSRDSPADGALGGWTGKVLAVIYILRIFVCDTASFLCIQSPWLQESWSYERQQVSEMNSLQSGLHEQ
jgi:hypothetical protein